MRVGMIRYPSVATISVGITKDAALETANRCGRNANEAAANIVVINWGATRVPHPKDFVVFYFSYSTRRCSLSIYLFAVADGGECVSGRYPLSDVAFKICQHSESATLFQLLCMALVVAIVCAICFRVPWPNFRCR